MGERTIVVGAAPSAAPGLPAAAAPGRPRRGLRRLAAMSTPIQHTAVVGAGAVGCFYAALLARAGHRVTLIGRPAQVAAIRRDGLQLQMAGRHEAIALAASTDLQALRDADLVAVAVKSADTAALARELAPRLAAGALLMSLQNGIDNPETLAAALPGHAVLPVAVYVATSSPAPGVVQHHGRGELVIGRGPGAAPPDLDQRLQAVAALFGSAGVAVQVVPDVMAELWTKLVVNCAWNAASALARAPYGRLAAVPALAGLQAAVVDEALAVARAAGVPLDEAAVRAAVARIGSAMPDQRSSTAQDLARGKPTEVDFLNGAIARRGAALGVAVPVNQALWALVRLAEAAGDGPASAPAAAGPG